MYTNFFRRYTAILAVAGLCCAFAPGARAVVVPVSDSVSLVTALANWSNGDLTIELAAGTTYDATSAAIDQVRLNSEILVTGMPGELTLGPSATDTATTALAIAVNFGFQLKSNGNSLFLNQIKFRGQILANENLGALSTVNLNRVWFDGGVTDSITVAPGNTLTAFASSFTGGTIDCYGTASFTRCTFMAGTYNLNPPSGAVNLTANLFKVNPNINPTVSGSFNYIDGLGNPLQATNPLFALKATEVIGGGPVFPSLPTAANAWGKLDFALRPIASVRPVIPLATVAGRDFEGESIGTLRYEIGADEVGVDFPVPVWNSCQITGPAGATLYVNDTPRSIPIVREGVPLEIAITATVRGISGSSQVELHVVSEHDRSPLVTTPIPDIFPLDVTNADLNGRFTTVVTYVTPGGVAANGLAEVQLYVNGLSIVNYGATNTIADRQILIDTIPPALPAFINDSLAPGALGCGEWSLDPSGFPVGTRPHFMYTGYPTLTTDFRLDLTDLAPVLPDGFITAYVAGFDAARPADDADVVNWPKRDAVFGNGTVGYSALGTAVWTNPAFDGAPVQPAALSVTPGATGASSDVRWTLTFTGTAATPLVEKWDAEITITDRAGNETTIPVDYSPRFWWMPEGSTFANVTPDNDAYNPQFSWSLGMTPGSNASVYDLPQGACVPTAQLLTCFADTPADLANSGWDSDGVSWTLGTSITNVDANTRMGDAGQFSLGELFATHLGAAALVLVRVQDPAKNVQSIAGEIGQSSLIATTATTTDLYTDYDYFGGVYEIPARVAEGALDTIASARYFLNRTDRSDVSRLWAVDPDETTYGVGPNVPLTPLTACGQRLEAEITVDVSVPDNLPGNVLPGQVSVEFQLYEDGRLVALGNLVRRDINSTEPFKLFIPTDLLEGQGNGTTASTQTRGVATNGVFTPNDFDVASFLNFPPPPCESSADLHRLNNDRTSANGYGDRLGDDGDPATKDLTTGDIVNPYRTRSVAYTLVLRATNNAASSNGYTNTTIFDTTPATIHFYVKPDTTTDSGVPPIKSNKKL